MKDKKGLLVFVSVTIFLLSNFLLIDFVTSATSSSEAEFNIEGCTFQFDDLLVGVAVGECSIGDYYGLFYCERDRGGYVTNEWGLGCSRGETSFESGTALGACCPDGYFCNENEEGGLFQCVVSNQNCFSTMTESECGSLEVDGYYYNGECVCERSQQSCEIYTDEIECGNDIMNIGSVGIGRSEFCGGYLSCGGTTFSVPSSSCGCSWNPDSNGGACEHSIAAIEAFSTATASSFECSSSYNIGDCVDGERDINWTSTTSQNGPIPSECFDILGCGTGSDVLTCGENFVKLPGFSLFSLFMSLFVIGIYYFVVGRFKHKRSHLL